jgi:PDZ domain-containing protein
VPTGGHEPGLEPGVEVMGAGGGPTPGSTPDAVRAQSPESTSDPAPGSAQPPTDGAFGSALSLHWRTALLLVSAFATVLLASATMLIPVPYVVLRPGPTINALGKEGGHDLITVRGHRTYPAKGALEVTTVTVEGGPGGRLSLYQVIKGWFDQDQMVVPSEVLYPPGETVERSREENRQEMAGSQESATVAALRELGFEVPATLTVESVDAGHPPSPIAAGDVILAVEGRPVADLAALSSAMSAVRPGGTVRVTVRRSGATRTLAAPTRAREGGRALLGIRIDPTFRTPFDVDIRVGNVGGPSAGMMFALGLVDVLTPGDLTGGARIAGTGTITESGEVGAIGGVQQKIVGASNAGARWFLAPADNCRDVVGHVPDGLRVVSVKDLHDARLAVERVAAGRTNELTFCKS